LFHLCCAGSLHDRLPILEEKQPVASYIGSVGNGLGFYHVDLPEVETTRWLNITNCGVVVIRKGELSDIFCKDWLWQVRELTPVQFLIRFSPHKRVSDLRNLPSFNLRKEGVQVGMMEWIEELDHFSVLREVWIQLEGIPPPSGVIGVFLHRWCLGLN
jgi:hypothetical protein